LFFSLSFSYVYCKYGIGSDFILLLLSNYLIIRLDYWNYTQHYHDWIGSKSDMTLFDHTFYILPFYISDKDWIATNQWILYIRNWSA
jgi:hypothetical protein